MWMYHLETDTGSVTKFGISATAATLERRLETHARDGFPVVIDRREFAEEADARAIEDWMKRRLRNGFLDGSMTEVRSEHGVRCPHPTETFFTEDWAEFSLDVVDAATAVAERAALQSRLASTQFDVSIAIPIAELHSLGIEVDDVGVDELPRGVSTHDSEHLVFLKPKKAAVSADSASDWQMVRKGMTRERTIDFAYNAFWNANELFKRGLAVTYVVDQSSTPWSVLRFDGSGLNVDRVNELLAE